MGEAHFSLGPESILAFQNLGKDFGGLTLTPPNNSIDLTPRIAVPDRFAG